MADNGVKILVVCESGATYEQDFFAGTTPKALKSLLDYVEKAGDAWTTIDLARIDKAPGPKVTKPKA